MSRDQLAGLDHGDEQAVSGKMDLVERMHHREGKILLDFHVAEHRDHEDPHTHHGHHVVNDVGWFVRSRSGQTRVGGWYDLPDHEEHASGVPRLHRPNRQLIC